MIGFLFIAFIISALIFGHELTRFLVAHLLGFSTPVFGLGMPFGPYLVIGEKWNTEFRIHLLLFGAYVSIPELSSKRKSQNDRLNSPSLQFSKFNVWQRMTVVLAGMGFYIALAWLLLFISANIAGTPKTSVVVQGLSPKNRIAADAGVKPGDYIIALDSKPVSSPDDVVSYFSSHPDTSVDVHIQRQEKFRDIAVTTNAAGKVGMLLLQANSTAYEKVTFFDSFGLTTQKLCALMTNIIRETEILLSSRYHMQPASNETKPRTHSMIAIIKMGADIVAQDWRQLPWFLAMLSIDMALVNLVPWPGFGGSHLLAILIDVVREKFLVKRER